jgi:hypothetical protein
MLKSIYNMNTALQVQLVLIKGLNILHRYLGPP